MKRPKQSLAELRNSRLKTEDLDGLPDPDDRPFHPAPPVDPSDIAYEEVFRQMGKDWSSIAWEDLDATRQDALKILVSSGTAEFKVWCHFIGVASGKTFEPIYAVSGIYPTLLARLSGLLAERVLDGDATPSAAPTPVACRLTSTGLDHQQRWFAVGDVSPWLVGPEHNAAPGRVTLLDARLKKSADDVGNVVEWSRLLSQTELREMLGVAQNTLAARLSDADEPARGKYRCKRTSKYSKRIQVAIGDLPESMQESLRSHPRKPLGDR